MNHTCPTCNGLGQERGYICTDCAGSGQIPVFPVWLWALIIVALLFVCMVNFYTSPFGYQPF